MATVASDFNTDPRDDSATAGGFGWTVLQYLGSLKLTVGLFACSLILVLVGTLAQDEMNMLEVKQRYFLSWIAALHFDDFFPQAFLSHAEPIPGVIPFPGGALIGVLLMINLVAAKITRFRIHASGGKLWGGAAVVLLGVVVAAIVVMAGHDSDGLQGTPPEWMGYDKLWAGVLAGMAALGVAIGIAANKIQNTTLKPLAYVMAASILGVVVYSLFGGFRIGEPGLRIVWQLTKGLGAGVILLVGCVMMFGKQGGNVLLHIGVGLLMVGQFVFGDRQTEQRLTMVEGDSTNAFINMDEVELVFIESMDDEDLVTAIPGTRLQIASGGEVISDPSLPVDVKVLAYYPNSTLVELPKDNLADTGFGLETGAADRPKSGGVDAATNIASAYIELLDKQSGESLGKHLVSQLLSDRTLLMRTANSKDLFDSVAVGDKTYNVGLKFHREVKPYWIHLEDFRRTTYSGTQTPRDYSSFVRIIAEDTGEDRKERIWMNNPLRYRGETFYQSSFDTLPSGQEMTSIQVVRNSGWLIPYVACSITALGMLAHFLGTLTRFLKRRERETRKEREELAEFAGKRPSLWPVYATVCGFGLFAAVLLVPWSAVMNQMRPADRMQSYDFYAAGKIPTQFGGRIMPLDAYARQTLKAISNKESLPLDTAPAGIKGRAQGRKLSAIQWLMEVAIEKPELRFLPMFRIDADEVRSELGLERRQSKLYSLDEIAKEFGRVAQIVEAAVAKDTSEMTFKEKKLVELDRRTRQFTLTAAAFQLPVPEEIPMAEFQKVFPEATDADRQMVMLRQLQRRMEALKQMSAPAVVAPGKNDIATSVNEPSWFAFGPAFFDHFRSVAGGESPQGDVGLPGIDSFGKMIQAYAKEDPAKFNEAVDGQLDAVTDYPIPGYKPGMVSLERWMQSNWPTGVAMMLYLATLVMGLVYFLVDLPRLRQAVWGTLALAMAIHTVAIICRISITGRAPVINLYSSAVFIGWAAVLFGLVVERIFKYGIGNILSAAAGVMTLLVAYGLNSGDTMPVLQAVLDTQFWLATHVISVTLGYVATMVAGTLGIGYLIAGWLGRDGKVMRDLYRCCYGAACFGILFSFVGTVLGGLWADDSWGRFWGWDPKENGALLIVIWNALMLHARWDGMVGARGFAGLAIGGNVVTAWSWFGTNELGIGLHSYGFTSGVLMWLSLFVGIQLAFVAIDLVMRWMGVRFGKPA
ncbi:Cytochrome c biogenesis protein CcsA [Rubripirellula lacrimiformis]|uniref:Cytochrome c biogenesis protein CcsA n=1 Tax=Rubripirellula lacrimiformis TaxID=1930273 RepID=A0A517N5R6_9BACT|nr:cytochrome c biogenesis protein CcsA [Rubripirellula lacrimiformis]QDT02479.1 Cytochrome c biogenesis protein CcsA [Rubripirellula lacrimiformis]